MTNEIIYPPEATVKLPQDQRGERKPWWRKKDNSKINSRTASQRKADRHAQRSR